MDFRYYTPDYIVKYIVENTLGPLVEDKRKKVSAQVEGLKEKVKSARGTNREYYEKDLRKAEGGLIDEILSLKVLDPAMGSGHFLVEATDFLARELLKALSGEPLDGHSNEMAIREPLPHYESKELDEEDIRWARREVVERCIFGVDLNPMAVELAKLSLWLYTVAKNRPLNFLDHHLRCGDSLIGAKIEDLANFPEPKKKKRETRYVKQGLFESIFREKVNILLGAFSQIERLPSDTVEQIREKEKLYQDFRKIVSRFQDVADVWTSVYFGNGATWGDYQKLQDRLRSTNEEWERESQSFWFKKAKELADEKRFFHWELEFPEVFFEGHQRKDNPGFDAVVGNPPYGVVFDSSSKALFKEAYKIVEYQFESFTLFIEKALLLLKQKGFQSYITPTTWLSEHYFENLRSVLLDRNQLQQVIFFKEPVFKDATVETCIEVVKKNRPSIDSVLMLGVVTGSPEDLNVHWGKIFQQKIEGFEGKRITKYLTPQSLDMLEKIQNKSSPLRNFVDICNGLKPYEVGKGNPPQTKKIVQERILDSDYKKDDTYKPYLRGEDFHKYTLNLQGTRWISYGEWLAAPRPETPFFAPSKLSFDKQPIP